jgi:hypothetical protein
MWRAASQPRGFKSHARAQLKIAVGAAACAGFVPLTLVVHHRVLVLLTRSKNSGHRGRGARALWFAMRRFRPGLWSRSPRRVSHASLQVCRRPLRISYGHPLARERSPAAVSSRERLTLGVLRGITWIATERVLRCLHSGIRGFQSDHSGFVTLLDLARRYLGAHSSHSRWLSR